ncbi:MAG: hypothetical protein Q8O05_01485 [Chloroflexota bacterium]|nr:hypothetical protein [Chloroflexota bacterium]
MPKSHRRGKHSFQAKKGARPGSPSVVSPPAAAVRPAEPVLPGATAPPARTPSVKARAPAAAHPYIRAELKGIGILGGIMLLILIVLALVWR